MRKKLFAALAAACLMLTLTCCGSGEGERTGKYVLYFPVTRDISYGAALATQDWEGEGAPTPEELMQTLLAGPTQEGLRSPFPGAVTLQSLSIDEEQELMRLKLSEQYSGLNDMAQTLADACVVLTACQLPGVSRVEISSDGFWTSRPASRTLAPAELELESLMP